MAYTTINKSTDYFNTKLYTGNGSTQNITGVGHQVDWTWIKHRTDTEGHALFDVLRGALDRVQTNSTNASSSQAGTVTAFGSDGFSLGNNAEVNANNGSYVSFNWKANGAGSANTDGSINTTATSVSTTSGVSISTYTGTGSNATVGHGLGAVPKMIMVKKTSGSESWGVYHHSIGNTKFLQLNATGAEGTSSAFWNNTTPTSSVFSIGTENGVNQSGQTYVAYCFADVQGFSKVGGSYTGNGNADGTFVYTGFKPAFVMLKYSAPGGGVGSWHMYDNKRKGYNTENDYVQANTTSTENSDTDQIDLLSNGFKCRATGSDSNENGSTYIYMAFAEAPLVGSNNVPCTAR